MTRPRRFLLGRLLATRMSRHRVPSPHDHHLHRNVCQRTGQVSLMIPMPYHPTQKASQPSSSGPPATLFLCRGTNLRLEPVRHPSSPFHQRATKTTHMLATRGLRSQETWMGLTRDSFSVPRTVEIARAQPTVRHLCHGWMEELPKRQMKASIRILSYIPRAIITMMVLRVLGTNLARPRISSVSSGLVTRTNGRHLRPSHPSRGHEHHPINSPAPRFHSPTTMDSLPSTGNLAKYLVRVLVDPCGF